MKRSPATPPLRCAAAFTLVELLLSMVVLSILMMMIVRITGQTGTIWRNTTAKSSQFREARAAFESITRNLSQATLNTYYDYFDADGNPRNPGSFTPFVPAKYGRQSDLRFQAGQASALLSGDPKTFPTHAFFFQAPLGFTNTAGNTSLNNLLNTWGYYLEFRPDTDRPSFIPGDTRYRYRLMEFMQPSESLNIYSTPAQWIASAPAGTQSHVIASNIIALVILPKLPSQGATDDPSVDANGNKLAPAYAYDSTTVGQAANGAELNSKNQLPPIVEVTMISIDEATAAMLENGDTPPDLGLDGLFTDSSPTKRREDLETLQEHLASIKANYRVFSTEVSLRGAKWSREQSN